MQPAQSLGFGYIWLTAWVNDSAGNGVNNVMNAPPQVQVLVVDGSQYAALAKNPYGLKMVICDTDSGVMGCLLVVMACTDPMMRATERIKDRGDTVICDEI